MLLFAFSLILAGGAVALTALLGIGPGFLQQMLMYSVAAVLGAAGIIGLLIALIERGQTKKREARLQSLREGPSSLNLAPPMPEPLPEPPPAPVAAPPAPAPVAVPVKAPVTPEPVQAAPATIDEQQHEELQAATTAPVAEAPPEPTPVREPADQLLHLDPEYELSEVKRVLRIWQMTLNEDRVYNEVASWSGQDGTQIDLVESDQGQPILEIRGPMAQELAEFLPQDLPVHPVFFNE